MYIVHCTSVNTTTNNKVYQKLIRVTNFSSKDTSSLCLSLVLIEQELEFVFICADVNSPVSDLSAL